jgi:hypothetical protein
LEILQASNYSENDNNTSFKTQTMFYLLENKIQDVFQMCPVKKTNIGWEIRAAESGLFAIHPVIILKFCIKMMKTCNLDIVGSIPGLAN